MHIFVKKFIINSFKNSILCYTFKLIFSLNELNEFLFKVRVTVIFHNVFTKMITIKLAIFIELVMNLFSFIHEVLYNKER